MTKKRNEALSDSELNVLKDVYRKLTQKTTCFICEKRIKIMVSTECSHNFCQICISKHLDSHNKCPECSCVIGKTNLIKNKSATLLFDHLFQIMSHSEKYLPQKDLDELKKNVPKKSNSKQSEVSTPILPANEKSTRLSKIRAHVLQQQQQTAKSPDLKSPTRMPSQFPNESSVISQYSINPEEKVQCWLETAKSGKKPTQERPIDSASLTSLDSSLVSASQVNAPKEDTKAAQDHQIINLEESQVDSLIVARKSTSRSIGTLNKSFGTDIILDTGPDLFQSQSEEYQNKKEERRMKKIEGALDKSLEKPRAKSVGLRRRRSSTIDQDKNEDSFIDDDIGPRKRKVVPIRYDEEDETQESPAVQQTVDLDDFEESKKSKASKMYTNKKLNEKVNDVPAVQTKAKEAPVRRSRLSFRSTASIPKSPCIVEVISPVSSPATKAADKPVEPRANKSCASVFSSLKKIKSDFRKQPKIVPLNVSTTNEKAKRPSPEGCKRMLIEPEPQNSSPLASVEQEPLIISPPEPAEQESNIISSSKTAEAENLQIVDETQMSSLGLIENSLPVESSPKRSVLQPIATTPTCNTPAAHVFSPPMSYKSPSPASVLSAVISPSTVVLVDKNVSLSSSTGGKKRKTFLLESDTGDILGRSPPSKVSTKPPQSHQVQTRVHFFKQGRLSATPKPYKVNFIRLGFLSPHLIKKQARFLKRRQMRDVAIQTSPEVQTKSSANDTTVLNTSAINMTLNKSVLCQTSLSPPEAEVGEKSQPLQESIIIHEHEDNQSSDDEDIIDKSQDTVVGHVFGVPAAKAIEEESYPVNSSDIIPASCTTPVRLPAPQIDTSSLSLSPPGVSNTGSLASLNESDYMSQVVHQTKLRIKRKCTKQLESADSGKPARTPKKRKTSKTAEVEPEKQCPNMWTHSSQDAVVVNALEKSKEHDVTVPLAEEENAEDVGKLTLEVPKDMSTPIPMIVDESVVDSLPLSVRTVDADTTCIEPTQPQAPKTVCEESDEDPEMQAVQEEPVTAAPEKVQSPAPISLIFTSLGRNEIAQIQKFSQKFKQSSVNSAITPDTTHLVVPHSKDMNTVSTLKFYLAVAKGLWVVSNQWILDCISSGKIIPEEPYEMKNMFGCDSPRSSRLGGGGIFKDFEIHCYDGEYDGNISKEQLKLIINYGGGLIIEDTQVPITKKYRIMVSGTECVEDARLRTNCAVVIADWVLESIESYRLASIFSYLPSGNSVTQVSQAQLDLPNEMLRIDSLTSN